MTELMKQNDFLYDKLREYTCLFFQGLSIRKIWFCIKVLGLSESIKEVFYLLFYTDIKLFTTDDDNNPTEGVVSVNVYKCLYKKRFRNDYGLLLRM